MLRANERANERASERESDMCRFGHIHPAMASFHGLFFIALSTRQSLELSASFCRHLMNLSSKESKDSAGFAPISSLLKNLVSMFRRQLFHYARGVSDQL